MDRIVQDSQVREGRPIIRGTRVTVGDILAQIARGATMASLLRTFPLLAEEDVRAALEFAAHRLDEHDRVGGPRLSIVVVVYSMPEQAKRTLYSLSTDYQTGVRASDYEVIVVENASDRLLGKADAQSYRMDARYFYREEAAKSPVAAANFGVSHARAPAVALMIDGARMVTPGVVATALMALKATERAVVAVPGYHLGSELQQTAAESGYDERAEATLLKGVGWPEDGYRLFDVAVLSGSCRGGFVTPFAESNFLVLDRALFDRIGGYEARFSSPGGGYCNLDLYKRVCERPDVHLFVTPGEGTFHQFHGGITTGGAVDTDRDLVMERAHDEYTAIRGHRYRLPTRQGSLFGVIPPPARRFVHLSSGVASAATKAPLPTAVEKRVR